MGGPVVTEHVAIGPLSYHTCQISHLIEMKDWKERGPGMRRFLPTLLIACALLFAQPIYAQNLKSVASVSSNALALEATQSERQEIRIVQSDGLTLSEAVEQVRRQYNGRIVSAETRRSGNREVHHIKVLMDGGKVKTVKINGRRLSNKG